MPKLTMTPDRESLELSLSGLAGPDFQSGLTLAKSVPGRRYDGDKRVWILPADPVQAEKVMLAIRPNADAELLAWIRSAKAEKQQELVTPLPDDADVFVPWRDTLYDFQRAFVAYAAENPKLILADDMGLGKTFQAISAAAERAIREKADDGPKLVVCPSSVKGVWARELRKWLGQDTPLVIVDATTAKKRHEQIAQGIKDNAWVIVNWEQIRVKQEEYEKVTKNKLPNGEVRETRRKAVRDVLREPLFGLTPWTVVIADEAHRAKSRNSLQTRGLWHLDADMKLALSGTPIMNSPDEIWPILKWLYPEQYTSYWSFFNDYVDHYEGHYNNKIVTGVKNPDALRFELSKRLVRRTKKMKLNLPPKVREYIPVTLGPKQRKLYTEVEKQMWVEIEQVVREAYEKLESDDSNAKAAAKDTLTRWSRVVKSGSLLDIPNGAVRTTRLRQVASTPALLGGEDVSAKLDVAAEIILDNQPKQFIVFSEFVGTCHILAERLRAKGLNAQTFTGDDSTVDRTRMEDQFQKGEIDVLIGTIPAMGEGVTLTAADTAIFIERHWTPAKNEQAEDRLWRNGQDNKVTILILEAEDTVDTSKVSPTNAVKRMIVGSVIHQDEIPDQPHTSTKGAST